MGTLEGVTPVLHEEQQNNTGSGGEGKERRGNTVQTEITKVQLRRDVLINRKCPSTQVQAVIFFFLSFMLECVLGTESQNEGRRRRLSKTTQKHGTSL